MDNPELLDDQQESAQAFQDKMDRQRFGDFWKSVVLPQSSIEISEGDDWSTIKEKCYADLLPKIDSILDSVGLNTEANGIALSEDERINKVFQVLSQITFDKWSFTPSQYEETKKTNCSLTGMLAQRALARAGIRSEMVLPVGHVMNIITTSSGEKMVFDARLGGKYIASLETIELNGQKYYIATEGLRKILPVVADSDSARVIIRNFEELKREGGDTLNIAEISGKMNPVINEFYGTEVWKEEDQRLFDTREQLVNGARLFLQSESSDPGQIAQLPSEIQKNILAFRQRNNALLNSDLTRYQKESEEFLAELL